MLSLKNIGTVRKYNTGDFVATEMDMREQLYLVIDGRVTIDISQNERPIGSLKKEADQFFGGLLFIRENPLTVRAIAETPVTVVVANVIELDEFRKAKGAIGQKAFMEAMGSIQTFFNQIKEVNQGTSDLFLSNSLYADIHIPRGHEVYLLDKRFECPICGEVFKAPSIRSTRMQLKKKGEFFINEYRGIDQLWFEIQACPACGYADRVATFDEEVKYHKDEIQAMLYNLFGDDPFVYSKQRNAEEVMNAFRLYEAIAQKRKLEDLDFARINLILYELHRRFLIEPEKDEELTQEQEAFNAQIEKEMIVYRDAAFEKYRDFFKSGILDIDEMQLQQLYLILGKLYEHRGENKEAMTQYRLAKMMRDVDDFKFNDIADEYIVDLQLKMQN